MRQELTKTAKNIKTAKNANPRACRLGTQPLLEKRPPNFSVTRKQFPSRITRNGLLSKGPLVYYKSLMLWEKNNESVAYKERLLQPLN